MKHLVHGTHLSDVQIDMPQVDIYSYVGQPSIHTVDLHIQTENFMSMSYTGCQIILICHVSECE
mgnify:CR=1 FL=1